MSSGDTTTTSTVALPAWQDDAWQSLVADAQAQGETPYQAYTGDQVVNGEDVGDIATSQDMIRDISTSSITGLAGAQDQTAANMATAAGLGSYTGTDFSTYDYTDPGSWTDPNTTDAYMSPYMDAVVANEQQNATDIYNQQQASRDAAAVEAGAFGGSRSAVVDAQATADLNDQLAEIQASGLQSAYESGQSQYNTETGQMMTVDQQKAEDAARVQAAEEQSSQFGAQQGLDAVTASNASAQLAADLGQQEYNTNVSNASLLEQQGRKTQVEQQAELDLAQQAFEDEQNYGWDQLSNEAAIVSGAPTQATTSTTTPGPSTLQTIAGLGTTALGVAGMFRKGGPVKAKPKQGIARLVK